MGVEQTQQLHRQFHFIAVQRVRTQGNGRRRNVELAQADARSHAARAAHLKKREPKRMLSSDRDPGDDTEETRKSLATPSQTSAYVSSCSLDPFVRLPIDLSLEERNLLHDYLTVVPQSLYRTTARSAFCPVRDTTLISIATNEIWLSWAILLMQHRRSLLRGGNPEDDPSLLHRRRLTYKLMNEKVAAAEDEALSDNTLYGLVAAGVAEHRVSGKKLADKHLEAGLTLWNMRKKKGLKQSIKYPVGLVFCNAYIGIGVDNFFKHYMSLVTAGHTMAERLKAIQSWNRDMRQCIADSACRPSVEGGKVVFGHPSQDHLKVRRFAMGQAAIIRGHVERMLREDSVHGVRTSLGALFAMNSTLWACRYDESVGSEYMKELTYYLTMSEPGDFNGVPQLTSMAVMYIIGFCGANLQQRNTSSRTRFDLWDVIKFVELMMLASEQSRSKMKQALASWLLADMDDPEGLVLWEDKGRECMIDEVEAVWVRKQARMLEEGRQA